MPSDDSRTVPTVPAATLMRNALAERPPDAWFDVAEAAAYCGLAERTIINAAARGTLRPDGKATGPVFRRRTLDAWLEARARR